MLGTNSFTEKVSEFGSFQSEVHDGNTFVVQHDVFEAEIAIALKAIIGIVDFQDPGETSGQVLLLAHHPLVAVLNDQIRVLLPPIHLRDVGQAFRLAPPPLLEVEFILQLEPSLVIPSQNQNLLIFVVSTVGCPLAALADWERDVVAH